MTAAEQIKQNLDIRRVVEYYGAKIKKNAIQCPFHAEKTASLKIKDEKWKCFGCGKGGSVIDYVMELYGINIQQAIIRLNHDFNLQITKEKHDYRKIQNLNSRATDKAKFENCKNLVKEYYDLEFKKHYRRFSDLKPDKFEELSEGFIDAMLSMNKAEARLELRLWS